MLAKHCGVWDREIQVGEMGVASTVRGIWTKQVSTSENKARNVHMSSHIVNVDCEICGDNVWTTDAINAVFNFRPRTANPIVFCNKCLKRHCEAVRRRQASVCCSGLGASMGLA